MYAPQPESLRDPGGSQQTRRWVDTQNNATPQQTQHGATQPQQPKDNDQKWQKLVDILKDIEEDLGKGEDEHPRAGVARAAQQAGQIARELWTRHNRNHNAVEDRLGRIEDAIKSWGTPTTHTTKPSWANIAAGARPAPPQHLPSVAPVRSTVRVRTLEAAGAEPEQLLTSIRTHIPKAVAVKVLHSGDVEVVLPNQQAKDQAITQGDTPEYKILRQDYPVEVIGVPLNIQVESGRGATNSQLIQRITEATKKLVPGITISRVAWLHKVRTTHTGVSPGFQRVKTRGTLIINLPTQEMQAEIACKGIVIDSLWYEARLYHRAVQVRQCFKCQQWGHTQSACGREERCGWCADTHETKECPKDKGARCVNCGKEHKAWQRTACKTFQVYLEATRTRQAQLHQVTATLRGNAYEEKELSTTGDGGWIVAQRKRPRVPTPMGAPSAQPAAKRSVGRPRGSTNAARDPSQQRIPTTIVPTETPQRRTEDTHESPDQPTL